MIPSRKMNLLTSFSLTTVVKIGVPPDTAGPLSSALLLLLRLVFFLNIVLSLRPIIPFFSYQDEMTDIPLTPSQRSLLGLNPSVQSTPASVASGGYITPPRYRRSSGSFSSSTGSQADLPFSDRRSISVNYSPLSPSRYPVGFSPTPSHPIRRRASGSPFSPSPTASPLFHKAISQSTQDRDLDLGATSTTGLSRSLSLRELGRRQSFEPGTPTPDKRSPVPGPNYKWLYDRSARLPKSESMGF